MLADTRPDVSLLAAAALVVAISDPVTMVARLVTVWGRQSLPGEID